MTVPVQIWGPGFLVEPLCEALRAAHLAPEPLDGFERRHGEAPLLLAYGEPVEVVASGACADSFSSGAWPENPYHSLLAALPALETTPQPWRLVNLGCFCPAQLVGWCIEPRGGARLPEVRGQFQAPEPLDALLTRHWLDADPGVLEAYLCLEHHPRAAAQDQRPADGLFPQRLEAAAGPDALAAAHRRWRALQADLARADEQLRELHQVQCDNQELRERVLNLELAMERERSGLEARIHEQEHRLWEQEHHIRELEARCSDLDLSLQLAQEDLGQLSRRDALLQELVAAGAASTRWVQDALAQALRA
ncbi:MAG: hypothetical protein WBN89_16590 [Prochlorococcaceae cyanobacterium]